MGLEIAAIAGIASLVGGGLGVMQEQEQAKNEQEFLKQQEALARQQAADEVERSERVADAEEIQGIETARRSRLADKKRLSSERARMATSGVSLTEGSPLQIEEENDLTSILNTEDIFNEGLNRGAETRYAGKLAERSLLFEADQLGFQRKLSKSTAKSNLISGVLKTGVGAAGSFMGAGGSFTSSPAPFKGFSATGGGGAPSFKGFSASPTGTKGF